MFSKTKFYARAKFPHDILEEALHIFDDVVSLNEDSVDRSLISYADGDGESEISARTPDANYRKIGFSSESFYYISHSRGSRFIQFMKGRYGLKVSLNDVKNLSEAVDLFSLFDRTYPSYIEPESTTIRNISVFIGHGRSKLWRDLKDHLHDLHGMEVIAYETGARAGLTIQEILNDCTAGASIAFLVHTGEDVDRDGILHARENVVHETGLFQGVLGFRRAIVLLEEDCNEFSNVAGLQQLRFGKGNIKEIFGDVLAIVRREFTSAK